MKQYEIFLIKVGKKLGNANLQTLLNNFGINDFYLEKFINQFYFFNVQNLLNLSYYLKCSITYLINLNYEDSNLITRSTDLDFFYNRIRKLLCKNNKNINKQVISCIYSFYKINMFPFLFILNNISQIYNCSVDYLLGLVD